MKSKLIAIFFIAGTFGIKANAQDMPDMSNWPKASKMAAEEMMDKYGKPDLANNDLLVWMDKGQWKKITVNREETKHVSRWHIPI